LERRKETRQISIVGQVVPPEITRSMVALNCGAEGDWTLKILERATIETVVLPKGYMATGSELRGEKRCGLKWLLATRQSHVYVRSLPEVTCEGKDLARGASVC